MNNPYEILEISNHATDEQVKAAYLAMQKKYHPDNYENGPLKEMAEEKSKEITEAFDQIMNERRSKEAQSGHAGPTVSSDGTQTSSNASFIELRKMIQNNQLVEAEEILDKMVQDERTAEWYFLKGSIFFSRGWVDDATNFFETACRMDSKNQEYKAALGRVQWQRQGNFGAPGSPGTPYQRPGGNMAGCSACDMCSGLLCADCCCECMGGDCIPCC